MKIDSECHCGYIAYEAEADPANAMIWSANSAGR